MTKAFTIHEKIWLYPGKAAWFFVTVPPEVSQDMDFHFSHIKAGWGSLPVTVTVGETTWKTSIFPDKKSGGYLLPVKKAVREKERIEENDIVSVHIEISA